MKYGSNYTHFAPYSDVSKQQGVIYNYHLNRSLAQQQLAQMISAGLSSIRIPMFIWAAEEGYIPDGWTLGLYGSTLDTQRMDNLTDLLVDIKNAGFEYVEVGAGGAGNTLSPYNWTGDTISGKWNRMANFYALLRPVMRSFGFKDWCFDLCGEWINPNNPLVMLYAKTIWTWYTSWVGTPCTDATISFTPMPQNIAALPEVFTGLNVGGPINWPRTPAGKKRLEVHVYGETPAPGWGSTYSTYCGTVAELAKITDPDDCDLIVGECNDLGDIGSCMEWSRGIKDNPLWTPTKLIQWPTRPGVDNTSPPVRGWPF